ncbi:MAG: heme ABC exporter ATP-binding protein CcmA [Planctomycetes bacterium]|nr:heme ABC exporter ATP-binding protein CcmA [Planctomycetota bacterium]
MSVLLDIRGLSRSFGDRAAVIDATLRLDASRALCIVGRNGAGKSTLLAMAAGVLAADRGEVLVDGRNVARDPTVRRAIGYMTDGPQLYEALTARENLAFFGRLYDVADLPRRIDELLTTVGLADRADEATGGYSAGMRRRLDLARVLVARPRLLLLDEPAVSLDEDGRAILVEAVRQLRQGGCGVLLTAHSAEAVADLADECLTIEAGRLASSAATGPGGAA